MESLPEGVVKMIEDPSWQDMENIPLVSSDNFNSFLKEKMNDKEFSSEGCNLVRKMLVAGGFLLDFGQLVVIKPQWLADSFRAIISTKNSDNNGLITFKQIQQKINLSPKDCSNLINIWERDFSICVSHPDKNDTFIIPSLLDEVIPDKINEIWKVESTKGKCVGRTYNLSFLPHGIFEGIFVQMCHISSAISFWRNGLLLGQNENFLLLQMNRDKTSISESSQFTISVKTIGNF